jgi:hypothetical protein
MNGAEASHEKIRIFLILATLASLHGDALLDVIAQT